MDREETVTVILRARQGAAVERVHTVPHHGTYSVGEHTFGMLLLLDVLYPEASPGLIRATLYHDLIEGWTGDLPGSVGVVDPELRKVYDEAGELLSEEFGWPHSGELLEDEQRWLSAVDRLELLIWCHEQLHLGNCHVSPILDWVEEWFDQHRSDVPPAVSDVVDGFEWRRLSGAEV